MAGWDRSNAPVRSHPHASPPALEATSDINRSRTGSARALSSGDLAGLGLRQELAGSGRQHAAVPAGSSTIKDFDIHLY
jgi:hypothetical protein